MKMRKLLAVILASALALSLLAGCGSQKEETKVTPQETASASSSAPEAAAETKEASTPAETQAPAATEAPAEEVTVESLLNGYFDKVSAIQSMQYNMLMDVAMAVTVFGQSTDVKMNMDIYSETYGDNGYMKGTMKSDSYGEEMSQAVEQYIMVEDGKYVAYSLDGESDSWSKFETETPPFSKDLIPKMDPSSFTLETVSENGSEQYKVSGSVDLKEMFEKMGGSFEELFSGVMNMDEENFAGKAELSYYFNKDTRELENLKIDMAAAFQEMFQASFAAMFEGQETEDGEEIDVSELFQATVDAFVITLKDIRIDQGKEIVLPEEAKNAALTEEEEIFSGDDTDTGSEGGEQELSVELAPSFDFQDEYYKFTCAGQEYTVGSTRLSEVFASGAIHPEDENYQDMVIEAEGSDVVTAYFNEDHDGMTFYVRNDSEEEKPVGECLIYGVELSAYYEENEGSSVAGITGANTMEEVFAKLGNPTYGYESEFYRSYDWESEDYETISVAFAGEDGDGTVTDVRMVSYNW